MTKKVIQYGTGTKEKESKITLRKCKQTFNYDLQAFHKKMKQGRDNVNVIMCTCILLD